MVKVFINSDEFLVRLDQLEEDEKAAIKKAAEEKAAAEAKALKAANDKKILTERNVNLTTAQKQMYIASIFRNVLGRAPSSNDLKYYSQFNIYKIANMVVFSQESKNRNKLSSLSNDEYVKILYKFLLSRNYDSKGAKGNLEWLEDGHTRSQLMYKYINSNEFMNRVKSDIKVINLNENLCNGVYNSLNDDFTIIRTSKTQMYMYAGDVGKVYELNINGKSISDLTGISTFYNLKKLQAYNNSFDDLTEVGKLSNLEGLYLGNCDVQFKNFVVLSTLAKLKRLFLINNSKLGNTNILDYLPANLEYLNIQNSNIKSFGTKITGLTNLNTLVASNNYIRDISGLENLKKLKTINLDGNNVNNLEILDSCSATDISARSNIITIRTKNLEQEQLPVALTKVSNKNSKLYSSNNLVGSNCTVSNNIVKFTDISKKSTVRIVGGALNGTYANYINVLADVSVKDEVLYNRLVSKLGNNVVATKKVADEYKIYMNNDVLFSVNELDLSATASDTGKITDITGISDFKNLKVLKLNNNNILNYSELSKLENLSTLEARHNNIVDLNSFANVKCLENLDASYNAISNISGIEELENLKILFLANNNISSIDAIKNLTKLNILSLSNNNIENVDAIANLDLEQLYLAYNKISDISKLDRESYCTFDISNNNIVILSSQTQVDMPQVLEEALNNGISESDVKCINCSINNGKINVSNGYKKAKLEITKGFAEDTCVNVGIGNITTIPQVTVNYEYSSDNSSVVVTLNSNEKLRRYYRQGWQLSDDSMKLTKTYRYNTEEDINISNLYGNETTVHINVDGVVNTRVPGLKVYYRNYSAEPTNEDVTLVIEGNEEFENLWPEYGWTLSEDKKTITKTFDHNINGITQVITASNWALVREMASIEYPIQNYTVPIDYQITTIDKTAPETTVEYSESTKTKSNVIATIWSNEYILCDESYDKFISYNTRINDSGEEEYGISLFYNKNTTENLTVKDLAGNESVVNISIANIDDSLNNLTSTSNMMYATNNNIELTLKANENISIYGNSANTTGSNQKIVYVGGFNVTKMANIIDEIKANSTFKYCVASSENELPDIKLAQNSATAPSSSDKITLEVTPNGDYTVTVVDNVGNKDLAIVNANSIDSVGPYVTEKNETLNDDGSITITLKVSEKIKENEDLNDWNLSADKMTLTKTFKGNTIDFLTIEDMAGNKDTVEVTVSNTEGLKYGVIYKMIDNSDDMLVFIVADRELQEIEGWTLSEDKKIIYRKFNQTEGSMVTIYGEDGTNAEVSIDAQKDAKDTLISENTDENTNSNGENTEDNTQSNVPIPQTGVFTTFAVVASTVILLVTAFVLRKYWKNEI